MKKWEQELVVQDVKEDEMDESILVKIIVTILLSICCFFDVRKKQVPLIPIIIVGIIGMGYLIVREDRLSYIGGAIVGFLCIALGKLTKEALGYGDGYLLLAIGLMIGGRNNSILLVGSLFLSAFFAIGILIFKKGNRKSKIPFVPFLLATWILSFFINNQVDFWIQ